MTDQPPADGLSVVALTEEQIDGRACIVCGRDDAPMVPIPDVETESSTQVFRCQGCVPRSADIALLRIASMYGVPVDGKSWAQIGDDITIVLQMERMP